MADPPSTDLVATLVPVAVGGLLGLAGGWVGPWLIERRKERAEKKKKRAEKFEELVAALYQFDHWIDNKKDIDAYGNDKADEVSPFSKIQAISSVYFPNFDEKIAELGAATMVYRTWMVDAASKRLAGNLAGMNEGFTEAYTPYATKREALLNALKELARQEFQ